MIQLLFVFSDFGLLVLRVALGLIMVAHGWPKIKNLQKTKVMVSIIELFGGLMIISGFLTQIAALFIFIQFIVAILKVKRKAGFVNGYEFDLLIAAAALALVFFGGGLYGLDEFFKIIIY